MAELSTEGGMTPGIDHAQPECRENFPDDHRHSAYLKDGYMSQYNMAAVVAGTPEAAVRK